MSAFSLLHPKQFKAQQVAEGNAKLQKLWHDSEGGKPYRGVPFTNYDYKGIGPGLGQPNGAYPAHYGRSQKEFDENEAWRKREKAKQGQPRRHGGSTGGSTAIVNPFLPGGYLG